MDHAGGDFDVVGSDANNHGIIDIDGDYRIGQLGEGMEGSKGCVGCDTKGIDLSKNKIRDKVMKGSTDPVVNSE